MAAERQRLERERQRQAAREDAINFVEVQVQQHNCGSMDVICQFCRSKNFIAVRSSDGKFISCCRKGKVKLPKPLDENGVEMVYAPYLQTWLSNPGDPNRIHFREHIRSYNNAVSFASMGAQNIDLPGRSSYVFKVHGQTYHRTSHLQPVDGQAPQFAQLYALDSSQATKIRQEHPANQECWLKPGTTMKS